MIITYYVLSTSEVGLIDFEQVNETDVNTMRNSVDGSQTFISYYDDNVPTCVSSMKTVTGPYTHDEMMSLLATSFWSAPYSGL